MHCSLQICKNGSFKSAMNPTPKSISLVENTGVSAVCLPMEPCGGFQRQLPKPIAKAAYSMAPPPVSRILAARPRFRTASDSAVMSRSDLREYLLADLLANGRQTWTFSDRWHYPLLHFQRHLRRAEYILNCKSGKFWTGYRAFASWSLRKHGARLGFTIIQNFFGPGLSVTHWGKIADQEHFQRARCRIHQGICLGWKVGNIPHLLPRKTSGSGMLPAKPAVYPDRKGVLS